MLSFLVLSNGFKDKKIEGKEISNSIRTNFLFGIDKRSSYTMYYLILDDESIW